MTINKQYFDVVINNNNGTFYITESSRAKEANLAVTTLEKIEQIIEGRFNYDSSQDDAYSKRTKEQIYSVLKKKASELHHKYKNKEKTVSWIKWKIFSREKRINAVHARIIDKITALFPSQKPSLSTLPSAIAQLIFASSELSLADLGNLGQVSRAIKKDTDTAIVRRAKELGYTGSDHRAASKHMGRLFSEINKLAEQNVIPQRYLRYTEKGLFRKKTLSPDQTVQCLRDTLTAKDFFEMFSNNTRDKGHNLYSSHFRRFRKMFKTWKIEERGASNQKERDQALFHACRSGDKNLVEIALQCGANVNNVDHNDWVWGGHSFTPIFYAASEGHTEVTKLLISKGADVNFATEEGITPLMKAKSNEIRTLLLEAGAIADTAFHEAVQIKDYDAIELLLKHRANINIIGTNGRTPLMEAIHKIDGALVARLLEHHADIHIKDKRGKTPLQVAIEYLNQFPVEENPLFFSKAFEIVELLREKGAELE